MIALLRRRNEEQHPAPIVSHAVPLRIVRVGGTTALPREDILVLMGSGPKAGLVALADSNADATTILSSTGRRPQ